MIGYEMGASLDGVYIKLKISPMENFKHAWRIYLLPTWQHIW